MKLALTFPTQLRPGQTWRVPERRLIEGLTIGTICSAASASGRESAFLVDRVSREGSERYYELVQLGQHVEMDDAQENLAALVSHVARTGQAIGLTTNGVHVGALCLPPEKAAVVKHLAHLQQLSEEAGPSSDSGR